MKLSLLKAGSLLLLGLVLMACNRPETPQEVARAFWQAMINNDAEDAVRYSSLHATAGFDRYSRDWNGMIPSWGKIIIDENEARIHTHMSRPDAASGDMLYFITYLQQQNGTWLVDYERTGQGAQASGAVADFVGQVTTMGREISRSLEQSADNLNAQMESLAQQFGYLAENFRQQAEIYQQQAEGAISQYGEMLRQHLDELASSLEEALQQQDEVITIEDRRVMEQSVESLNQSSKALAEPDLEAIAETGEVIIITRKQLEMVDAQTFAAYQQSWEDWLQQVEDDMAALLNEITTSMGPADNPAL